MLRLGVAGVLVGMGMLAGCQDLATPDTNTSEQALDICDGKMPLIKDWTGAALQPTTPSSVFVAFQYAEKQQVTSATPTVDPWLISELEADTGTVVRAIRVNDDDPKFASLSENLVRLAEGVRIPGIPPEPCHSNPTLCYPFISAVVLHTNQALYDARKEAGTCF